MGSMRKNISGVAFTWLGVIGAAITLFAGLLSPPDMSDWAWWLVQNWQDATPAVWDRVAGIAAAEVPAILIPPLTISVFLVLIGIGVGLREQRRRPLSVVRHPVLQLAAVAIALLTIAYALLGGTVSVEAVASVPSEAPLTIFLAGAAVSFSPLIAGSGNLTTPIWLVLLTTGFLLLVNELTKIVQ